MKDAFVKLLGYFLLLVIFASLFWEPIIGFVIGLILLIAFKVWR